MKFWNWITNEADGERTLCLNGVIAEDSWFGDEVTPKMFKDELNDGTGNISVYINSPGGDVFAAAQIYNMLMEYKGHVTIKIDALAASAASVVAMAGSEVQMSPVSMLMLHNPATFAWGDSEEMRRAKELLDEVKESIINAYQLKTSQPRAKLSQLMDAETWLNAYKAVELGFADKIMFIDSKEPQERVSDKNNAIIFSRMAVTNSLLSKIPAKKPQKPIVVPIESLEKRLSLLSR